MKSRVDITYSRHPVVSAIVTETRGDRCVRVAISEDAIRPHLEAIAKTPRQIPGHAGAVLTALDSMIGDRPISSSELDAAVLKMATPMLDDVWRRARL